MRTYFPHILGCTAALGMLTFSCSKKSAESTALIPTDHIETVRPVVIGSAPRNVVAHASAFRMSGDYADHVAVTVGAGGRLVYFPAPTDLSPSSAPVEIGEGWWLNRQGLSANSVFTKWTFAEYVALPTAPSPTEIHAAVIPGAHVTAFRELPVTTGEALKMAPDSLLVLINRSGLSL